MKVIHLRTQKIIAKEMKVAQSFFERLLGLMFIKKMNGFDGLLLSPCKSVHNFFVRFSIDLVFLNKENVVVKVIEGFKPWRVSGIYFRATKVLELPAGTLNNEVIKGDTLEFRYV